MTSGELSESELRVQEAFPTGSLVDLTTGDTDNDDPANGMSWGPDRQVRAEILARLACGEVPAQLGHVGAVRLRGVRVMGLIDLREADVKHRLTLEGCHVSDGIDLSDATTRTVVLRSCQIGPVNVRGTTVEGWLGFTGTQLDGRNGRALFANGLVVTQSVYCDRGFCANGQVAFHGARIGGRFSFRAARVEGKGRAALAANGLVVGADMVCDYGFVASGAIRIRGATIGGRLSFAGARLEGGKAQHRVL